MQKLRHRFVETIPQPLEEGVVYVSVRFRVTAHNCCCGCGNEVVTNLSPNGWRLTYDGESVSLYPSIGVRSLPCRSHYWINRNTVQWTQPLTDWEIARAKFSEGPTQRELVEGGSPAVPSKKPRLRRLWSKLMGSEE